MKLLKNIIIIIIALIITPTLIGSTQNNLNINSNAATRNRVNVGVIVSNFEDPYISLIKQSLENIQINNENKVNFTFFDAKNNEAIQYEILDTLLRENIDLLLVNLVDTNVDTVENFIDKAKQKSIPLILFNAKPSIITSKMKDYKKFLIITTEPKQSGVLQGKLIVNEWNKNRSTIDKNRDNVMQYILLQGELDNTGAIERTKSSISTIENAGIKTQELALQVANWNQELAKNAIESLFLKYNNKIEVIISNNDAMAIGAIEALQKYGYNKGDPKKYIPVFGIDGIPAAQDLIRKGFMTGTVIEDPNDTAEALYTVGINLVNNKPPLENTSYKFDETETTIIIPYREYTQ
jgi:methyl-galactoside transport system substrate-binding protein